MGFNDVQVIGRTTRGVTNNPDGVSVGIYSINSRVPRLTVFIGRNILTRMGLKIGERVVLAEGHGVDSGMFQIRPAGPGVSGLVLTSRENAAAKAAGTRNAAMPNIAMQIATMASLAHLLKESRSTFPAEPTTFQTFGSSLVFCVPWAKDPAPTQKGFSL